MTKLEAQQLLKNAGCHLSRSSKHEIWVNQYNKIFALPMHTVVSMGVERKIIKFLNESLSENENERFNR